MLDLNNDGKISKEELKKKFWALILLFHKRTTLIGKI